MQSRARSAAGARPRPSSRPATTPLRVRRRHLDAAPGAAGPLTVSDQRALCAPCPPLTLHPDAPLTTPTSLPALPIPRCSSQSCQRSCGAWTWPWPRAQDGRCCCWRCRRRLCWYADAALMHQRSHATADGSGPAAEHDAGPAGADAAAAPARGRGRGRPRKMVAAAGPAAMPGP